MSDAELLHLYVSDHSESAFQMLVDRYLPMVYAAALRQVGLPALAEDVAQVTFIILARKAARLSSGTVLPGWLFRTTRHAAAKALRTEHRRRRRELEAFQMQVTQPDNVWDQVAPELDDALAQLGELDRGAVLLHYFQNQRLREVGRQLGMGEDAAQKRVARAVEKLRRILLKRGVTLPGVALPGLLMSHGVLVAPTLLSTTVTWAALNQGALSGSVYALLQAALVDSPWLKVGIGLARIAAAVVLAGLAVSLVYFWPHQAKAPTTDYTFESTIVRRIAYRPRPQPTVAVASVPSLGPTPPLSTAAPAMSLPKPRTTNAPSPRFIWITNTPVFAVGRSPGAATNTLPLIAVPGATPQTPDTPGPYVADPAWAGQSGYGYAALQYHWQLDYLRAAAYSNQPMWMPVQRSPTIVIRGGGNAPGQQKKRY